MPANTSHEQLQEGYERVAEHMQNSDVQTFPVVLVFIDEEKNRLQIGVKKQAEISLNEVSTQLQALLNDIPFDVGEAEGKSDAKKIPSQEENQPQGAERIRPLQGGTRIASRGISGAGTLGIVTTDSQGFKATIITAGHVMGPKGSEVGQPSSANGDLIGEVVDNGLDWEKQVDVAFVEILNAYASVGVIWTPNGNFKLAGYTTPDKGSTVTMYGSVTPNPAQGILARYASIRTESGLTLKNICFATYQRAGGDSGAPIVGQGPDGLSLVGIHQGAYQSNGVWYSVFSPPELWFSRLPLNFV